MRPPILFSLLFILTATAAAAQQADLSVTITSDFPRIQAGGAVRYRVTVKNNGPDTVRDGRITINRPEGLTSLQFFGFTFGCNDLTCTVGVLGPNQTTGVTIEERFDSTPRITATTVTVSSPAATDPNPDNNTATATTEIVSLPDLFAFTDFPPITEAEAEVSLLGGVSNQGPAPAHDVLYTVDFPSGTIIRGVQAPAGWTCAVASPKVTCMTPLLAANFTQFLTFQFKLTAPPRYNGGFDVIRSSITTSDTNFRPGPLTNNINWTFYRLYVVSNSADAGFGSLREAILQSNSCNTFDCRITFRIPEAERNERGWFVIQPQTPLPPITTQVTLAGPAGTLKTGTRVRPQVVLDGSRLASGNGLEVNNPQLFAQGGEIIGLSIIHFPGAGISVIGGRRIRDNFIGTLPDGVEAAPNERGIIGTGGPVPGTLSIHHNVISGNRRSGITLANISRPQLTENAIGLGADGTTPVPNGASGVYLAEGCDWAFLWLNDLAYNRDFGLAIHPSVRRLLVSLNAIYRNGQLGIDYGLDLATPNSENDRERLPNHPVITSAKFDPVTGKTTVEGTMISALSPNPYGEQLRVELYTDEGDHPQAREFLITAPVVNGSFRATLNRDLRGQPITSIGIRYSVGPWFNLNEETSEISDPLTVQ